jgi:hypothetical protein
MEHILDRVRKAGFREAVAWSDVRLRDRASGPTTGSASSASARRDIDDIDQSHELGFLKRF